MSTMNRGSGVGGKESHLKRAYSSGRFAVLLLVIWMLSACSSGDLLSSGCDIGPACSGTYSGSTSHIGGTASAVRAQISGRTISIDDFYASCRGVYPDSRFCGLTVIALDRVPAAIGGNCQFTVRSHGTHEGVPVDVQVLGSLDTESCRLSGTFDYDYGSCCSSSGTWGATRCEGVLDCL